MYSNHFLINFLFNRVKEKKNKFIQKINYLYFVIERILIVLMFKIVEDR